LQPAVHEGKAALKFAHTATLLSNTNTVILWLWQSSILAESMEKANDAEQAEGKQQSLLDEEESDEEDEDEEEEEKEEKEEEEEDEEEEAKKVASSPEVAKHLKSIFDEEDDEEEEAQGIPECSQNADVIQLLKDYDVLGKSCPLLSDPDCFSPSDLDRAVTLLCPTTKKGGWRTSISVIETMLEARETGRFESYKAWAVDKWTINKPKLVYQGGDQLPKGALPICPAMSALHGKHEAAHDTAIQRPEDACMVHCLHRCKVRSRHRIPLSLRPVGRVFLRSQTRTLDEAHGTVLGIPTTGTPRETRKGIGLRQSCSRPWRIGNHRCC